MKKTAVILLTIALFTVIYPSLVLGEGYMLTGLPITPENIYLAPPEGQALLRNIDFQDIRDHWARQEVSRVAALSLIRGMGQRNFAPNRDLTREEALALIIRTMGLEEQAQREGAAGTFVGGNSSPWAWGYIQTAANQGIITLGERYTNQWNQNITRLEFGRWIARAVNLEPIYGNRIQEIYRLNDWNSIPVADQPIVEALIQQGLMVGYNGGFNPHSGLTRAQGAVMIDRIKDAYLNNRGYREVLGLVVGFSPTGRPNIWASSGEHFSIGGLGEVPIIKGGIPQGSNKLALGDVVLLTIDGDRIVYGEVKNTTTLEFIEERIKEGVLEEIYGQHQGTEFFYPINQRGAIFKFLTPAAIPFQLEVTEGEGGRDILYMKTQGSNVAVTSFHNWQGITGQRNLRLFYDNSHRVVMAMDASTGSVKIGGTIEKVDVSKRSITIMDWNYRIEEYTIHPHASVTQNGRDITLDQLLNGQEVSLTLINNVVHMIEGLMEIEKPGYIPPGGRVKWGSIQGIKPNGDFTIKTFHGRENYSIGATTIISKNGRRIEPSAILPGDLVYLHFDSIYTTIPSKIDVMGKGNHLQILLKGKVSGVYPLSKEIMLTDVKSFDRGQWQDAGTHLRYRYGNDTRFNFIEESQLRDYTGREVYIGIRYGLDGRTISFIFPIDGFEQIYYGKITDIDNFSGQLVLDNIEKITFSDLTETTHSRRFLDTQHLDVNQHILLVGDRRGGNVTAKYISIEEEYPPPYQIVKGRINTVEPDRVIFRYYRTFEDHNFLSERNDTATFYLNHQTYIYDDVIKKGRIGLQDFIDSRYDKIYENNKYLTYTVATKDGELVGTRIVNISPFNYQTERVSTGIADTFPMDGWVTLRDMKDYNAFYSRWDFNRMMEEIDLTQALIVKDNRVISYRDIKPHDKLYIVRETNTAYIVIVMSP